MTTVTTPTHRSVRRPSKPVPTLHREAWESANRRGLLYVHAFIGLMAGALILFTKSARSLESLTMYARPITALLALVGGALL